MYGPKMNSLYKYQPLAGSNQSMLSEPIQNYADVDSVKNVFVFISDSFRFDRLPEKVSKMGITAQSIAASTYTASSVPSMFLGVYPPKHCIWDFSSQVHEKPAILDITANTEYWTPNLTHWAQNTLQVDIPDDESMSVSEALVRISTPFCFICHDIGGHLPYGNDLDDYDRVADFLHENHSDEDLRELYEESVSKSVNKFVKLVDILKQKDMYHNTLVIFTSDHGEMLGEYGGLWSHGRPIVPELVRTPMVLMGAGLPCDVSYNRVVSGVDLAPTLLGGLDSRIPSDADGVDLWTETPPSDRLARTYLWQKSSRLPSEYKSTSFWDRDGGVTIHHGSRWRRALSALGIYFNEIGPANRPSCADDVLNMFQSFILKSRWYGSPKFDRQDISDSIEVNFNRLPEEERQDPNKEQLEALGYRV